MKKSNKYVLFISFILISFAFSTSFGEYREEEEELVQINRIAVLDTDYGIIKFELYENWTPITTQNFIQLAESGHYSGVLFHRIVDDFVIQTGDGGGTGDPIPLEIHPNATHVDGAVGMARSEDPDSAEDQFYICDGAQHGLDGDYAVFGLVIEGIEVVREIAQVPVYGENNPRPGAVVPLVWYNVGQPKEDVFLNTVTIVTPEVNETSTSSSSGFISSEFPFWALGFLFVVAIVALVFFKNRIWP